MTQKDIYLTLEGDAWFKRNEAKLSLKQMGPSTDPALRELADILPSLGNNFRILEIGCGDGGRLAWMSNNWGARCVGLDPSTSAINSAREKGVDAVRGTADSLPFESCSFDVVMFGWCLCLCDREDLFRIGFEADRVLRSPGWLVILDFFSPSPTARDNHHKSGLVTYKMDYRRLFTWHPQYVCVRHKVQGHDDQSHYTDRVDDWTAISVLRKHSQVVRVEPRS
jgi:ubiquinone/menaquinone biosynthesis C-methylase UbiE